MKTGAELKARRLELGITQHDLAGNAGISRTQLSRMENGKIEIPSEIMEILCDLLYAKHEKPKLQFSDLEVGDYVYVRDDLVDGKMYGEWSWYDDMQKGKRLKIEEIECGGYINDGMVYTPEMLDLSRSMKREDYEKTQEKEKEYTLDEVYNIAYKAYEDNLIDSVCKFDSKENSYVEIYEKGKQHKYWSTCTTKAINFIQSLYQEEFVIETMSDELRVKSGAELTLSNGINCVYFDDGDRKLRYDDDFYPCNFLILKGATVKQLKGAK